MKLTFFVAVLVIPSLTRSVLAADRLVPSQYPTIEEAINASVNMDVVLIDAGRYTPLATLDLHGKAITLRGAVNSDGTPATVIDGLGNKRVFQVNSGEGSDSRFENLRVTGGFASSGGGMWLDTNVSPTISNCRFESNYADSRGGGMYLQGNCNPTLTNCVFESNSAGVEGGGMFLYNYCSPEITNCRFVSNMVSSGTGGGIHLLMHCNPSITNCLFSDNDAGGGAGALLNYHSSPVIANSVFSSNRASTEGGGLMFYNHSSPTMTNCLITSNQAAQGGGIYAVMYASPVLSNCSIYANVATGGNGGGMFTIYYASPALTDCLISSNSSALGGGVSMSYYSSPTLTRCHVIHNDATTSPESCGGGVYVGVYGCFPLISYCTIRSNSSTAAGGGIWSAATNSVPNLTNSALCGNDALTGSQVFIDNWINDRNNCIANECSNCDEVGGPPLDTDGDGQFDSADNCPAIANPLQSDCNNNGVGDVCEIAAGAPDFNADTVPDTCQCLADLFVDHQVNGADLGALLSQWGPAQSGTVSDINRDGQVNGADLGYLLNAWGSCTN